MGRTKKTLFILASVLVCVAGLWCYRAGVGRPYAALVLPVESVTVTVPQGVLLALPEGLSVRLDEAEAAQVNAWLADWDAQAYAVPRNERLDLACPIRVDLAGGQSLALAEDRNYARVAGDAWHDYMLPEAFVKFVWAKVAGSGAAAGNEVSASRAQYAQSEFGENFEAVSGKPTPAMLTSTVTCTEYTPEHFTFRYEWSWDKMPETLAKDIFSMEFFAYNEQGQLLVTKFDETTAHVEYYDEDGRFVQREMQTMGIDIQRGTVRFDVFDLEPWLLWAKNGIMTVTISPAVGGNAAIASVQVRAGYEHAGADEVVQLAMPDNFYYVNGTVEPLS